MNLKDYIREFPDFPKPGILFKDISPLLKSPEALRFVVEEIYTKFRDSKVDLIAGVESRGFIFASILALRFDVGCLMIRKRGKLPGEIHERAYDIEYGNAVMEVQKDAISPGQRVLIIDDLLATGGTAQAAAHLVEHLKGEVAGCSFVVELGFLPGRAVLRNYEVQSLVVYEK